LSIKKWQKSERSFPIKVSQVTKRRNTFGS